MPGRALPGPQATGTRRSGRSRPRHPHPTLREAQQLSVVACEEPLEARPRLRLPRLRSHAQKVSAQRQTVTCRLATLTVHCRVPCRACPQVGPSGLEGVAGLAVGGFAEREDLRRCDAEDEPLATAGIAERPVADLEVPVELRLPDG